MFLRCAALAVCLLSMPICANAADCGNGPIVCTPMYGLYNDNSSEKKQLDDIYKRLVRDADNDLARLHNSKLATAISEIRNGAANEELKFWVLLINPTKAARTAKFYVMSAKKPFKTKAIFPESWINCPLAPDSCKDDARNPFSDLTSSYNDAVASLRESGEIIGESVVELPADSVKAVGIAVPEVDGGRQTAIALLGASAARRIRFDERDLLRLGLQDR